MKIEIPITAFDPWATLHNYEQQTLKLGQCGAVATFVGKVRNHNAGQEVSALFLEHYPGMTETYLHRLGTTAMQQWDIVDVLIVHRVGNMQPDETIVLIAVWAEHRTEALEACHFLIEELKAHAPFWKRETLPEGTPRWVEPPSVLLG